LQLAACGLLLLADFTCNSLNTIYVVTGEVSRLGSLGLATGEVILGQAQLGNPSFPVTPTPGDTSFLASQVPSWLAPVSGASVTIGTTTLTERVPGVYFSTLSSLPLLQTCNLSINVNGVAPVISGQVVVPDSFTITQPPLAETLHRAAVMVTWTRSESAQRYTVSVAPVNPTLQANGFSKTVTDTFCEVTARTFAAKADSQQTLSGPYLITVMAINGGWSQSLGSLLTGGLVQNALGVFGAATVAIPWLINVLPD
jgi:hypothetical protein